jgi:hypothetical protein
VVAMVSDGCVLAVVARWKSTSRGSFKSDVSHSIFLQKEITLPTRPPTGGAHTDLTRTDRRAGRHLQDIPGLPLNRVSMPKLIEEARRRAVQQYR